MSRQKMPDRRPSLTQRVVHEQADGKTIRPIVTFGLDEARTSIREVFCADFKAGSDMSALVSDACIMLSRLLQHGAPPAELAGSMCNPPSVIGSIAKAVHRIDEELRS